MTSLTPRQSDALSFIRSHQAEKGFAPSYDEIAAGLGLASKSRAFDLVKGLERRGAVRTRPGMFRTIEIIEERGAEFHLKAVLAEIGREGCVYPTSACVVAAMRFLGDRTQ
ncbi:hypothetical protein [Mesorhizobium sp. B1-1-5]|uniref:LexA family protein n=1 Tax=Mesorhizobium sp. B1-1-5 TaxID=2589979 RepID=UPI0011269FC6|nr:hypothetical protein [Mesorhizobium sp. B1-1-5]TPN86355.1 hypothetical protein FJ980_30250 [Mesorhizobium sp. B1-1-5]